jgi:hypothetical protein
MRISFALPLLALLATPALARYDAGRPETERHPDPLELGELFCKARVADDMSLLGGHLAPILIASIDDAQAKAEALLKRSPMLPTPLHKGLPWQTRAERPTSCTVELVNGIAQAPVVMVKLNFFVAGDSAAKWADTIQLERTPTSWLIDNVFYANGGNMRFKLAEAFN